MKKLILLFLVSALLSGCGTTRQLQVVREVSTDTVYLNHIQYDSVYIDQWQYCDRSADTIYLEKVRLEYKYKFLKDTVRIVQIDSIPVIREVEVVREPVAERSRSIPGIYKWSLAICIALLLAIILFIAKKFFL